MINPLLFRVVQTIRAARQVRRWRRLERAGLRVGEGTELPPSLWIDTSCPYAISIGRNVGFGPEVLILAHDAQMRALLGVTRVAPVRIGDDCRIGARTLILPGVEIGEGSIVFAGSVVSRSLPSGSVCGGSPARALGTVEQYLASHREQLGASPTFPYESYGKHGFTAAGVDELRRALSRGPIYILGSEWARAPGGLAEAGAADDLTGTPLDQRVR